MADEIKIRVNIDDREAVAGAKRIKASLDDIKRADAAIDGEGTEHLGDAARDADGGYSTLKATMANLASQGIALAVGKAKDLAASVVEIGSGFESSMSNVSALSGATGEALDALEAKARELGATTTFSAGEAADALSYMALAGWDTQQMLDGVGGVLTLAQAGQMDLAASSDLVTDYLSAFNMKASETGRMVDVLAYAQANANTTVDGLGQAFKNCAANCNAAGLDVETTTAALAMLANQGLKGSEGGTALTAVMRDMTAKMKDGAIAIGDANVKVMDAQGNYRDFAAILADVERATDGMGDAEKAAALQSTFTADSIKGLNLLLNAGADEMAGFRDELYASGGAAEALADTMTDNLQGDLAAMNSALEETALKIYDGLQEPLRSAVQFVTGSVVPAIEWMLGHLPQVGVAAGAIAAAVAAMNFSKIATFLTVLPKLLAALSANPVVLVIAAVAGLAEACMWAYDNVQPFRDAVDALGSALADSFGPMVDEAASMLSGVFADASRQAGDVIEDVVVPAIEDFAGFLTGTVVPAVGEFAAWVRDEAAPAVRDLAQWVGDKAQPVLEGIAGYITGTVVPALGALASWIAEEVVPRVRELCSWLADNALPVLSEFAQGVGEFLAGSLGALAELLVGTVFPALQEFFAWFGENVMPKLEPVVELIGGRLMVALGALLGLVGGLTGALGGLGQMFEGVCQMVGGFIDAVAGILSGDGDRVREGMGQLFGGLGAVVQGAIATPLGLVTGFVATVADLLGFHDAANAARGAFELIKGFISDPIGHVQRFVSDAARKIGGFLEFSGVASKVRSVFNAAKKAIETPLNAAKSAVKRIINAIKGFFSFSISWPHIPLPRFVISPSGWQIGDLLKGSIPSLKIDWYAKGGVFDGPSVIGVGEAGREAVVPLQGEHMRPFAREVADNMPGGGGTHITIGTVVMDASKFASAADYEEFFDMFMRYLKQAKEGA